MTIDGKVVGDPMERAVVEALGWKIENNDTVKLAEVGAKLKLVHKFPFSS